MNKDEWITLEMPRALFEDAVLCALEKDTGATPIVGEILRICKIKMNKYRIHQQRCANLRRGK